MVHKMKVKETNKCSYCSETVDFIEHFFCECPVVRSFWRFIEQEIKTKTGTEIKLSNTDILFGTDKLTCCNSDKLYINYLILIGKVCISIYKKTDSLIPLKIIFERELGMRYVGFN